MHPLHQRYDDSLIDPTRLTRDLGALRADIPVLMAAYTAIKAALERARVDKVLGSPLQSFVILSPTPGSPEVKAVLERYADELDALFVVSSVLVLPKPPELGGDVPWSYTQDIVLAGEGGSGGGDAVVGQALVLPPRHDKCPRCWRYVARVEGALCRRCRTVVESQSKK